MHHYQDSTQKKQTLADLLDLDTDKKNCFSFDMYSKQFTHDQGYQDLMNVIHFERNRNASLKTQIEQLKKGLVQKYLARHFQQLQNLSLQNQELRAMYRQETKSKNNTKAKQLTPKQSLHQIRTYRKSIPNANFATQFSGINNKKTDMRMSYKPVYESNTNLTGGTSLMPSPRRHKRRESQLTQRKDYPNQQYTNENSYIFQQRMSQTRSLRNNPNSNQISQPSNNNIFVQFLQSMLLEQKITDAQLMQDLNQQLLEGTDLSPKCQIQYVNQLQTNIKTTSKKLENLQMVVKAYQNGIQQIGVDLSKVSDMTTSLLSVKGKYLEMQQKVNGIKALKQQLYQKQQKLNKLKKQKPQKNEPFQIPQSLKTLFKIINLPSNTRPSQYISNLKKMSKNVQILFPHHNSKTKTKVKQLIDGIRDGRKKFNEVLSIYEGRIQKLQQKISKAKQQKQRKSIQQKK